MNRCTEGVDAFADSSRRHDAIAELGGAINAKDLLRVVVRPDAGAALIARLRGRAR